MTRVEDSGGAFAYAYDTAGRNISVMRLTARGYHRVLRVARTLADLEGAATVRRIHTAEALAWRRAAERVGDLPMQVALHGELARNSASRIDAGRRLSIALQRHRAAHERRKVVRSNASVHPRAAPQLVGYFRGTTRRDA